MVTFWIILGLSVVIAFIIIMLRLSWLAENPNHYCVFERNGEKCEYWGKCRGDCKIFSPARYM